MASESADLCDLLIGSDSAALKKVLKQLDTNHELEKVLDAALKACAKIFSNAELQEVALPFLSKHFATIPSARAKTLATTLIKHATIQFSPKIATLLLRALVNVTQLTNAEKLRELIKTEGKTLHNDLRKNNRSTEADNILVTILNVLLFEVSLLDGTNVSDVEAVWKDLTGAAESSIYQLASFIFFTTLKDAESANEAELALCKFANLDDKEFITFAEPFVHVPIALFQPAGLRLFLDKILVYYIANNNVTHFMDLLLSIPEIRNSRLPSIDVHLISSVLLAVWNLISNIALKRKAETETETIPSGVTNLVDIIFKLRRNSIDLTAEPEIFVQLFSLCAEVFTKLSFNRDMKATAILDVLNEFQSMIPALSGSARGLLVAVLPFALSVTTSDAKFVSLIESYISLVGTLPEELMTNIFASPDVVGYVLSCIIKRCSRDCPKLRYACAGLVAQFLRCDWVFVKAFVKGKALEDYKSLSTVFNKALHGKNPLPSTYTTICLQALVAVYEKESEVLRSSQFKPTKGLTFLLSMSSQFISTVTADSTTLSTLIESSTTILIETATVQVQATRLAALVGIDVDTIGAADKTGELLEALFKSKELSIVADQQFVVIERLLDAVFKIGFHSGLSKFFTDADKLVKIASMPDSEPLLGRILHDQNKDNLILIRTEVQSKYPLETLSSDRLLRNAVLRLFYVISKQQNGVDALNSLEDFIFTLFCENECVSTEAINFAAVYLDVLKGNKYFGDFIAIALETVSDLLASQKLFKVHSVITAELNRSLAAVAFLKKIFEMPLRVGVSTAQFAISGRLLAKLILNLNSIRHIITSLSDGKARRDPTLVDILRLFDHFQKQLTNVCKRLVNPKEGSSSVLTRQLPFVVSNCLTGEREPNLPTYLLLSGCDDAGIALLSATLPPIEKRRFAITFPNFVEQNKFTG